MITVSPLNGVLTRMATLSRAMDDVIGRTDESLNGQDWIPAMDAWETEQAFVVQLDLPGLTAEQVDVSFDRNTLLVQGTRTDTVSSDESEKRVFFVERTSGAFTRKLRFPQYVDTSRIDAKFANGVLTITVPKSEAAKPRKIAIAAT